MVTDKSFFVEGGALPLHEKIQKYINRVATSSMGPVYAARYLRELKKREAKNAKLALENAEDEEEDLLA